MSFEDPIADATEGVTKGILNWTKEQVISYVQKLRNKDLAFIKDIETIELVREQLKTGEWDISSKYVKDKDLRLLIQMGLTLRKLENDNNFDKLQNLRNKISFKFGNEGLHIAQFVQNRMLGSYLGTVMDRISSINDLERQIEEILKNVDKYVIFIKEKDDVRKKTEEIKTRIYACQPKTFILFSKYSATHTIKKILETLKNIIEDYSIEYMEKDNCNIIFLTKNVKIE